MVRVRPLIYHSWQVSCYLAYGNMLGDDEFGRGTNVVQASAIQTLSEAPAASHTLHVSVCFMSKRCECVCVPRILEAVLSHFLI